MSTVNRVSLNLAFHIAEKGHYQRLSQPSYFVTVPLTRPGHIRCGALVVSPYLRKIDRLFRSPFSRPHTCQTGVKAREWLRQRSM